MHIETLEREVAIEINKADIIVDDIASMEIASEMVLNYDALKKRVEEYWAPDIKSADETSKKTLRKKKTDA
jgi:hypothetical protein